MVSSWKWAGPFFFNEKASLKMVNTMREQQIVENQFKLLRIGKNLKIQIEQHTQISRWNNIALSNHFQPKTRE